MTYTAPLSADDAATIAHAAETRILEMAMDRGFTANNLAERYGEARKWLVFLMQGKTIEIDETELAASRKIMTGKVL